MSVNHISINMEYLIYDKSIDKKTLLSHNILIDAKSDVANGVKISPNVCIVSSVVGEECVLRGNTTIINSTIATNCNVSSSEIEDCTIGSGCDIGPFAHIRKNSALGNNIRVGNFVEIKNSRIGDGTKMAHLSYIGDAEIGVGCNIGCGVVFCNYNGKIKQKTKLGDKVFVGSNSNLVAPLIIGSGAYIAAGSTINKDVLDNEFAIARERQTNKNNFKNPFLE